MRADITFSVSGDPFVAKCLGKDSYRVFSHAGDSAKDGTPLTEVLSRSQVFCYSKVSPSELASLHALESYGFHLVDTNVQLRKNVSVWSSASKHSDDSIRWAKPSDEQDVARCAAEELTCSRFHLDPLVTAESANGLKREWARNYFLGKRGDAMVVAEREGRVVGFLQILCSEPKEWTIDLTAVSREFRRQGLGRAMIEFAQAHYSEAENVLVGTQAANAGSISFYQSAGFQVVSMQHVFHYHGGS